MKFGLESEKHLFNLTKNKPSGGVFSFIDALSDYNRFFGKDVTSRVTNEFVLNMVEIGTLPSSDPMEIIQDYLLNLMLIQTVSIREDVALVPLAALPMDFLPHMIPKWPYYVQNSILSNRKQDSWNMENSSPLKRAGNCAGIHVHVELETAPEFLFSNRELQDKFNMGLMMTPMIAFGSSPYFFDKHEASSMRGLSYYNGVYADEKLNGGLPPVMASSAEVLEYFQTGINTWIDRGVALGFPREELSQLTGKKGANWNPVRWNRAWNTIEIRCLDSDSIDLDAAKFIWMTGAMNRLDTKGENFTCRVIDAREDLSETVIDQCFSIEGSEVLILSSKHIADLFNRAITAGVRDELVERYLNRLHDFAVARAPKRHYWAYEHLLTVLRNHETSSERILAYTNRCGTLTATQGITIVHSAIKEQKKSLRIMQNAFPDVFERLKVSHPELSLHH